VVLPEIHQSKQHREVGGCVGHMSLSHDYQAIIMKFHTYSPFVSEDANLWMPVDTYVGGVEHGEINSFLLL
jgi:leucyl-tRNA synthetase